MDKEDGLFAHLAAVLLLLKNLKEHSDNESVSAGETGEASVSGAHLERLAPQGGPMEPDDKLYKPSGELTIFEAAEFKESLIKLFACEGLVCMDLSKVTRVDTSAIQLMWAARKLGRLLVTGIPQELETKLTQLGFSEPLSE